ncbi:NTP transferase domain-containing protein [Streptomyces sp. DSM 44917]|uniref:NTP transferase domain-containing protein n=1 Tax=Streptomyces boetiae TaxID=3075541 RepID=A0ABU2L6A9_9ACTN|nr:NTP transferase domain-containing protein [Streptomyces sp. DSM 44917]MDT0307097.1 NTP transferase domain-containing protein [Streptomyces sp. DSM 44917]
MPLAPAPLERPTPPGVPLDAVVLAGGAARRLGGADKPAVRVGGRTLLDRVLAACAGAGAVAPVVVGPRRPTVHPVRWAREDPPGGGPLAALDAGLRQVVRPVVAVLAADQPFLAAGTLRELLAALPPDADAAVPHDAEGRDQPLTAVYRTEPLRRELALLTAEYGTLAGLPLRLVLGGLALRRVEVAAGPDCDTWGDIATARARIRDDGTVLDEWLAAVKAELGIDPDVDTAALLDAARDAAHGVARPAAPLTTFLIGYAAALHGIVPADAARKVSALAESWREEAAEGAPPAGRPGGLPRGGAPEPGGAGPGEPRP